MSTSIHFSKYRVFQNFFLTNVAMFTLSCDETLSGFRDTAQKMQKYIEMICRNHVAKSRAPFPEVSEIAETTHFQK